MGRAYTKYYQGFTLSFRHDSDHCTRCKTISTFYSKMKNKEPPWDKEDARKVEENCPPSQLKLYGVISYLNAHLKVNTCDENAKNSNHVPAAAHRKRHATHHQVLQKRSRLKSSDVPTRNSEARTTKRLGKRTMPSYQGYRKVVKKAAQRSAMDQNHEKAYKTKILNLKSSPKSPEAENSLVEPNNSSSVIHPVSPDIDKVSLKRKLRILNKLKRNNKYEDDIFEEKCFYVVKTTQDDESDSSDIKNMATPKCEISLSPRARSESPVYEDCYSPKELGAIRRDAEEFRYRRIKRRRRKLVFSEDGDLGDVKEDVKSENPDHQTLLENVCKAVPLKPEKDSDSDNSYFTDSSEDQS